MTKSRDEFTPKVRGILASRASYRCSICEKSTIGPGDDAEAILSDGIAAHITAAAPGGPRFDRTLSQEERGSPANGIWLCTQHGREVDADVSAFPREVLRGLKRIREEAARKEHVNARVSAHQTAQLIEIPYVGTDLKLFEIIAPQPYTFDTITTLRGLVRSAKEPSRILQIATELIPSVWDTNANVAGILSSMLSTNGNYWQPSKPMLSKLEQLCDVAIQSGDWSRVGLVEPLAFALGAKGSRDIHRRTLERLVEEPRWRSADSSRNEGYYGTLGVRIAAILRHWHDPYRNGLLRVHDAPRLMDLLLSMDWSLASNGTRQAVLALLEQHALALKDLGEGTLAGRVHELLVALRTQLRLSPDNPAKSHV
jgi:hypothetical protein